MSAPLTAADGEVLAGLAAAAVAAQLAGHPFAGHPADGHPPTSPLHAPGATFITLSTAGQLRGCIGSLEAQRPLYRDVTRNAVRAMTDPRFRPVNHTDWPHLDVSVSVLSPPEPIPTPTPETLLAALRPHVDGLTLTSGRRRATFLPRVWEKLPTPEQFVAALLAKGGWPPARWPPGLSAHRYTAREFHNLAPRPTWR
ncbi:MAG: AmmeMemoRadiSam system protein A [Micromonosporaceae bacterium]|nr:AmmeMemoRadiSam system protein A [Micromonosporaceae bacterium]